MSVLVAGAYARTGVRQCLALDVGTSTVRLWTPATATVISAPAAIVLRPDGRHVVGRAALDATVTRGATPLWPVRDGLVHDFFGCMHLVRTLVTGVGQLDDLAAPVLVGVPATATLPQKDMLVAAVRRAVGGRVTAVEEPLAAALACRPDPGPEDVIAVDIGFGRTEVVRIVDRTVAAAERVGEGNPVDHLAAIAACVRRMDVPGAGTGRRRLLVTGGGAAAPGVAARLAALTRRSVTVPTDPLLATLTGLRRLLTS
ncbi:rod shape-determining protein [Micromonospora sp. NPDC051296]|uniref:rod shape-determining protein n=1 Tax=Micromonospora sp. NPDC051296 TaxID=3155046 RepID=UPI003423AAB7